MPVFTGNAASLLIPNKKCICQGGVVMFDDLRAKYPGANIVDIFLHNVEKYADKPCVYYRHEGVYVSISWNELAAQVCDFAFYLINAGIKRGDTVAIFSHNRYEWWIADMASLSVGAVTVPIYSTNSTDEAYYILKDADCVACVCGGSEFVEKILPVQKKLKSLKHLVSIEAHPKAVSLADAIASGQKKAKARELDKRRKAIKGEDLASLIYTSGTTGDPKGVMLTHDNFYCNVMQLVSFFDNIVTDKDTFLSFLPLSHALERTAGYYIPITFGSKVAFADSFKTIQKDLQDVSPTIIISVPRLYEKMHEGILAMLPKYPLYKRLLFKWAMACGKKYVSAMCRGDDTTKYKDPQYRLADKLILSKLRKALGLTKMRIAISGGAPLALSDLEFFLSLNIRVLEGFGLTECSPVTNVNRMNLIKPGTVGAPLVETKIRISDEGEIEIKGPQVMKGYYKRKQTGVFTRDGYYRSGDLGHIDEDGYLTITGRIKDVIVTAGGKNISPQKIENILKASPYIENIAIIGDRRKYLTAVILPNMDMLKNSAKSSGQLYSTDKELLESDFARKTILSEIETLTKTFARVEQIKGFTLVADQWSQASGELTPTLKIKRAAILEKYAEQIEAMYRE